MLKRALALPALKRVLQNFAVLAGGRAVGGVLGFLSTLLSARALGPDGFGTVAMIGAYMLVVRAFCNVKPFEAIVRYGVALDEERNLDGLARLLRVSLALDCLSALFGTLLATAIAWWAREPLGWSDETARIAVGYCTVLLFSGTATASGALRIFDRFDAISIVQAASGLWRLLGVGLLVFSGHASIETVAAVWASAQLVQYVGVLWFGAREVAVRLPWSRLRGPLELRRMGQEHPDLWSFLNVIYWQATLDMVPKSLGTLYAGALLGAEGAAMYRIAREFANVVAKPAVLVRQAIYPDLARLRHRGDRAFSHVVVSMAALMGVPALALAVVSAWWGDALLAATVGPDFAPAAGVLTWLIAAATLELAAAPLRPAGYALGVAKAMLGIQALASVLFIAAFQLLTPSLGLIAPGVATLVLWATSLAGMAWTVRRALED